MLPKTVVLSLPWLRDPDVREPIPAAAAGHPQDLADPAGPGPSDRATGRRP
jgi:hypothetical protein